MTAGPVDDGGTGAGAGGDSIRTSGAGGSACDQRLGHECSRNQRSGRDRSGDQRSGRDDDGRGGRARNGRLGGRCWRRACESVPVPRRHRGRGWIRQMRQWAHAPGGEGRVPIVVTAPHCGRRWTQWRLCGQLQRGPGLPRTSWVLHHGRRGERPERAILRDRLRRRFRVRGGSDLRLRRPGRSMRAGVVHTRRRMRSRFDLPRLHNDAGVPDDGVRLPVGARRMRRGP